MSLDMIRPYLSYIINNQGEWNINLSNTITDNKTQGEWKLLLTMAINSISLKILMRLVPCIQKVII